MPEVSEVALTSEVLNKYFVNVPLDSRTLISLTFVGGRYTKNPPNHYRKFNEALPMIVDKIDSRGKFMWFELRDDKEWFIWNTFGLTGMWSLYPTKYTKAVLTFASGQSAYFSDMRNFGTLRFSDDKQSLLNKLRTLGVDFLKDNDFNLDRICSIKRPIVAILMDQGRIGSGLGNYLTAEILYRAKIDPHRLGTSLTENDIENLDYWIKYVVKLSYVSNHIGYMVNLNNEIDNFPRLNYHPRIHLKEKEFKFLIYRQKKDPYGNPVKADKIIKGRTTYWVPKVQK